jgi:hypothetical protein
MAYVHRRTTKAGLQSTALVEAYRDDQGRPRQRRLANLHGEPDPLRALAKLAVQRDALRKERDALAAEAVHADRFYETISSNALAAGPGGITALYSTAERKEIDRLMRQRERLLKRLAAVNRILARIQKDGVVIKKHCAATPDEVQAAIKAHQAERDKAEAEMLGLEFAQHMGRKAKAKLRRLGLRQPPNTELTTLFRKVRAGAD